MKRLAACAAIAAASAAPAQQATPLFAADEPIKIEIAAPFADIVKGSRTNPAPRPATLAIGGERHAIRLTPRGITRLRRETCQFPPLRVDFTTSPAAPSAFAGQRRLKLVTHCRQNEDFQQHLLLEYGAYRLYNLITPQSFRVRLATIDYVDSDRGKPHASRYGFFIEERDDVGRRIGLHPAVTGDRASVDRLDPAVAARFALFEYMIGNLDWSMWAGPPGEGCCHNSRLFVKAGGSSVAANLVSVPYDFDYSGLVDAPYAVPPDGSDVSVRKRDYQGYCRHNSYAIAALAEFRAKRGALLAEIARIPGLDNRNRRKATDYLEQFFADIATDQRATAKLLADCIK